MEKLNLYSSNIKDSEIIQKSINGKKLIAYIPLDDRPCNVERVELAAQAMGMEILMPPIDYFKTNLDNQPINSTGKQIGSPSHIVTWLKQVISQYDIDAFLVSLDQLCSGGLVGSRALSNTDTYIWKEKDLLNDVLECSENKPIYFFDTVMRLATTVGYEGLTLEEYNNFRNYATVPRRQFFDGNETVRYNNILNGYNKATNGSEIKYSSYGLSETQLNDYISTRKRKFKLNVELGKKIKQHSNAYLVYGVDDGSQEYNVQTNEIKFLEDIVVGKGKVFTGTDELGMSLLSRIATDLYCKNNKTKVKVTYFGGGENLQSDAFDYHTLKYTIDTHIEVCGGVLVNSGHDIELLVLTKPNNGKTLDANANDLHYQLNQNNNSKILTSVIDTSTTHKENPYLQRRLLGDYGKIEISKLISYSSWNTVANTVGMALGHAIGRCAFLKLGWNERIRYALEGQVKLLFTEFAKDICYWVGAKYGIESYLMQYLDQEDTNKLTDAQKRDIPNNFYKYGLDQYGPNWDWKKNCLLWASFDYMTRGDFNIHKLAGIFCNNGYAYETYLAPNDCALTQINWINYPYENGDSYWFNLEYSWHRTFECKFPVQVSFK